MLFAPVLSLGKQVVSHASNRDAMVFSPSPYTGACARRGPCMSVDQS